MLWTLVLFLMPIIVMSNTFQIHAAPVLFVCFSHAWPSGSLTFPNNYPAASLANVLLVKPTATLYFMGCQQNTVTPDLRSTNSTVQKKVQTALSNLLALLTLYLANPKNYTCRRSAKYRIILKLNVLTSKALALTMALPILPAVQVIEHEEIGCRSDSPSLLK